ncbi:MAG: magnesium transporter CorA family protein [Bacteroidales bacterium]
MLKIYKSFGGFSEISQAEQGCWVNVIEPTHEEIARLQLEFDVPEEAIRDILDVDERPRYEYDDDWSLVLFRIPIQSQNNGVPFYTVPLGIFMTEHHTVTLCSVTNEVLQYEQPSIYKESRVPVHDLLNFVFKLFLRSATTYLRHLKHINQQTSMIEQDLEKSIKNKELNKLLKMEKCLVYFVTSLKANEIVLTRLKNSKSKSLSEINEDLLEDAIIENKQALEMAQIYSDIQTGMMDAFASVISNNLNVLMKRLTSISIIIMLPTLVSSIFGMNVPNYLENSNFGFMLIIFFSLVLSFIAAMLFRKFKWF